MTRTSAASPPTRAILRLLETLYGRPAFPFQTLTFPVGTQQPPHSDSVHFSAVPDGFMCGVWVALEDIDTDNGPLIYYPGSHRWPHFGNEHIGVNAWHQPTRGAHAVSYRWLWDELVRTNNAQAGTVHREEGPGDHLARAPAAWRRQAERSDAHPLEPGDALLFPRLLVLHADLFGPVLRQHLLPPDRRYRRPASRCRT